MSVMLTGPHPVRITAAEAQELRLALDCADFDEIAVELRVFALEGTEPTLDLVLETGMQLDTDHGWVTLATFPRVSSAPAIHLRLLRGFLRYLRWRVTALAGTGLTAATFIVDGIARAWTRAMDDREEPVSIAPDQATGESVMLPAWDIIQKIVAQGSTRIPRDSQAATWNYWYQWFQKWQEWCGGNDVEWNLECTHEAPLYFYPFGAYPTIQSALDAIPGGSVLCIPPGRYYENLEIRKNVIIRGQFPGQVHLAHATLQALLQDKPLIRIHPGVLARLENLHLHYGRIAGPQPGFLPWGATFATPILDLFRVQISDANSMSGAITGRLHLRGRVLTIHASNGHGIDITGSADIANSYIRYCKRWGMIIDNRGPTPTWWLGTKWLQQVCVQECDHNDRGGLWLRNHGGKPFRVSGPFTNNAQVGVWLDRASGTTVAGAMAANTRALGELPGIGLLVTSAEQVHVGESAFVDNDIGLYLVGCGQPTTSVYLDESHFVHNGDFDLAAIANDDCSGTLVPELHVALNAEGQPNIFCHPNSCQLVGAVSVPNPVE